MSEDKRLGSNPLDWMDPNATMQQSVPLADGVPPVQAPVTSPAATAPDRDTIFTRTDNIAEEDLMGKGKVKIKQTMETASAVAYLEDLAQSLSSGIIRAESGDDSVVLCVAENLKFEMKLSRKKDQAKCSIELEWNDDGHRAQDFRLHSK